MNALSKCTVLLAHSLVIALLPVTVNASAYEPVGINLGGSSFMDGFGRFDPGFTLIELFQYKNIDKLSTNSGRQNSMFDDPKVSSRVSTTLIGYTTPYRLLGGSVGVEALLPIVHNDASVGDASLVPFEDQGGTRFGDLTWGAFLQMDPVMDNGRPEFVQRFAINIISPTGAYNDTKAVNASSGFWSFNPYWAMTYLPTPEVELSTRINYLYNFKNNDPNAVPPGVDNFQAGDAMWANFTASYAFWPSVRLGLNGYYFKQLQNDKENGQRKSDSRTTDFSMGPGGAWEVDRNNILFSNIYIPVTEKNTVSGFHMNLRWVHMF